MLFLPLSLPSFFFFPSFVLFSLSLRLSISPFLLLPLLLTLLRSSLSFFASLFRFLYSFPLSLPSSSSPPINPPLSLSLCVPPSLLFFKANELQQSKVWVEWHIFTYGNSGKKLMCSEAGRTWWLKEGETRENEGERRERGKRRAQRL